MPETKKQTILLSLLIGAMIGALLGLGHAEARTSYQERVLTEVPVTRIIHSSRYIEERISTKG